MIQLQDELSRLAPPRRYPTAAENLLRRWGGLGSLTAIGLLCIGCKPSAVPSLVGEKPGEQRALSLGDGVECEFRWIPPGSFVPLASPGQPSVIPEGFWIAAGLTTEADWQKIHGEKPAGRPPAVKGKIAPPDGPVHVSWDDCQVFLEHLKSPDPQWTYQLAGVDEWEYACRAGSAAPATTLPTYGAPAGGETCGNAWSIRDMHGDVKEWCRSSVSPNLPKFSTCGKSADGDPRFRPIARGSDPPFLRVSRIPFRIVLVRRPASDSPAPSVSDRGERVTTAEPMVKPAPAAAAGDLAAAKR